MVELLAAIKKEFPSYSPTFQWIQMISVRVMQGSQILAERKAAQGRAPAYAYMVSWETPAAGGLYKSPHTIEIPFVFDLVEDQRMHVFVGPDAPKVLSRAVHESWVAFARDGAPVASDLPEWPPLGEGRPVMVFDAESRLVDDPQGDVRRFWDATGSRL